MDLFREQQDRASPPNLEDLFIDGWNPKDVNGTAGLVWARNDERKDVHGPEICWDHDGSVQPLGLIPMTDEEKEVCRILSYSADGTSADIRRYFQPL